MRVADIAVVGAGPAGAAAATLAARAGLDVVLVDKAVFPRDKCCGDGLTAGALRELEALGLEPATVPSWQPVTEVVLHAPSWRRVELTLPSTDGLHSVVARRRDLDAALVDVALKSGAELWSAETVQGTQLGPDGTVVLDTTARQLRVRAVVGADGMWSPLRKLCGTRHTAGYRGEWHAFRQYFGGAAAEAATQQHIWFPADLLPAYVWSFPLPDGGVNVGYGIERRPGAHAPGDGAALWRELVARPEITAVLGDRLVAEGPMRAWPIPARLDRAALTGFGGRVLFAGDAAAAPDPMTGEGIGQALHTGRLAAQAIIGSLGTAELGAAALTDAGALRLGHVYHRSVHDELVADHRLARGLGRILASRRGAEWALRAVDLSGWTRREFARWMFEDYPRAVLATPRRWRRGMLQPPGAFPTIAPPPRHAGPSARGLDHA